MAVLFFTSKGIGEPALFLGAAVFYAIKAAISDARKDAGLTGVFCLDSPATAERIRMACVDQFTQQVLLCWICVIMAVSIISNMETEAVPIIA